MALVDKVRDFVEKAKEQWPKVWPPMTEKAWEIIPQYFPGITPEILKQGWIPIHEDFLQKEIQSRMMGIDGIERLSLSSKTGHFLVEMDTCKYALKHKIKLKLCNKDFTINKVTRIAVFVCDDTINIEGRDILGKITAWLTRGIILRALKSQDTSQEIRKVSEGMMELRWPELTIYLDQIPEVNTLLKKKFLDFTLTDFLTLGPLTIEDQHVRLKISRGGYLAPQEDNKNSQV
jgi:hypothetical protein